MKPFSPYHIFWLAVTVLFAAGCIGMRRFPLDARWHRILRCTLFAAILISESAWFVYRHTVANIPLAENLPLHLCDLSVFVALITLATGGTRLAELAYFTGVVGALLAIAFPAISETGSIRQIAILRYFVTHIALVGCGFYFTFGRGLLPGMGAVFRCYAFIHVYAMLVTPLNLWLGTNYFYTISAPEPLAWMLAYPHAVFLGSVSAIFLVAFTVMQLPFRWLTPPAHERTAAVDNPS